MVKEKEQNLGYRDAVDDLVEQMKYDVVKENVVEALKEEVATVTFTKKDGTERVMMCTLNPAYLPEATTPKTTTATRKPNNKVVVAYDIEKEAFRSFRLDSVTSFETDTQSSGPLV
jgi:hypothetical protein